MSRGNEWRTIKQGRQVANVYHSLGYGTSLEYTHLWRISTTCIIKMGVKRIRLESSLRVTWEIVAQSMLRANALT